MTGVVLDMGEGKDVQQAKQYQPGQIKDLDDLAYTSQISRQTLENGIQVFESLDSNKRIIPYFQTSQYGIESQCRRRS